MCASIRALMPERLQHYFEGNISPHDFVLGKFGQILLGEGLKFAIPKVGLNKV